MWNQFTDKGCNFKCDTAGKLSKQGEMAAIVRPEKALCSRPPPPPPPQNGPLCPDGMPGDWRQPCLSGDLFYSADPSGVLMPTIGNGHLATFVQSGVIYAAGLFDGDSVGATGKVSHRATIPAYQVSIGGLDLSATRAALDVRRAVFMTRSEISGGSAVVDQKWYAVADRPSLIVHEMTITVPGGKGPIAASLSGAAGSTADLSLEKVHSPSVVNAVAWTGRNVHGELGNTTTLGMVCTSPPSSVTVPAGGTKTMHFITSIVTSLNSTNPIGDATAAFAAATSDSSSLFAGHVDAWARRWDQGSLEVENDLFLAQALNASLYAIRASIRPDWPYGLSPGGLASDAYEGPGYSAMHLTAATPRFWGFTLLANMLHATHNALEKEHGQAGVNRTNSPVECGVEGHTFWDQETWMWPPLLMLDPPSARSALDYRWNRREGAHNKSLECGASNHASSGGQGLLNLSADALMFPWESCLTGTEVQFSGGHIGPWGEYEQHISGDIALASRQYWYAHASRSSNIACFQRLDSKSR